MLSESSLKWGRSDNCIRELSAYGAARKAEIGAENVFDFSIGNPSVPAPQIVAETLKHLLDEPDSTALHGYTSAQGDAGVRAAIASYIEKTYAAPVSPNLIYMTAGAAAALTISLNALLSDDMEEEVIVFAPFFPEYRVFTEKAGGKLIPVLSSEPDFQIDFERFEKAITPKTKVVIVNSPNNPTGVVLTEDTICRLATVLKRAEDTYGHPIYLISDEPYRELVYGNTEVPYLTKYYRNTLVCYSFSKALSLPGERIGYILVSPNAAQANRVYAAILGAGRALGYVCAPSLFQYMIPACLGKTSELAVYERNRTLLYEALTSFGYTCASPDGAFYLFVKALEPDAYRFCETAKKWELLLVPSDDFGYPGYVRIAYCVKTEQIERSLPAFQALAAEYQSKQYAGE